MGKKRNGGIRLSCGLSVSNHGIDGVMGRWSFVSRCPTVMLTLSAY